MGWLVLVGLVLLSFPLSGRWPDPLPGLSAIVALSGRRVEIIYKRKEKREKTGPLPSAGIYGSDCGAGLCFSRWAMAPARTPSTDTVYGWHGLFVQTSFAVVRADVDSGDKALHTAPHLSLVSDDNIIWTG